MGTWACKNFPKIVKTIRTLVFLQTQHFDHRFTNAYLPTMARLDEGMTFLAPEGSLTRVLLVSGLWLMMVPKFPLVRASLPRSPVFSSMQQTMVPSGITPTGRMLPICRTAVTHTHHPQNEKWWKAKDTGEPKSCTKNEDIATAVGDKFFSLSKVHIYHFSLSRVHIYHMGLGVGLQGIHPRIAVLYSKDKSSIPSVLNMTHKCDNLMHSNGTGSTKLDLGVTWTHTIWHRHTQT